MKKDINKGENNLIKPINNSEFIEAVSMLKGAGIIKRDAQIAKELGVSPAIVSEYINNKKRVGELFMIKFVEKFKIVNKVHEVGELKSIEKENDSGNASELAALKRENALLQQLLKAKEEIETLKAKPENTTQVPLKFEVADLIDQTTMRKIHGYLGEDIYRASICVSDASGRIEFVNNNFTNQTGYDIQEVIGKKAGEVLQRADADLDIKDRLSQAIKAKTYYNGEILNYGKYGEKLICRLILTPVNINGVEKIISIAKFAPAEVTVNSRK